MFTSTYKVNYTEQTFTSRYDVYSIERLHLEMGLITLSNCLYLDMMLIPLNIHI